MNNFLNLISNEQMKLYAKKSTWIMIAVLAIIALAGALIIKFMDDGTLMDGYSSNWKEELQVENERLLEESKQVEYTAEFNEQQIARNNYYLDNNIKPQSYDGWQYMLENVGFTQVISLFTIIVAAGIIANEFKWGTIKLLLIRPISRTKILFSKYISVLIYALTLLLAFLLFSWIVGALFFGLNGMNPIIIQEQADGFVQTNLIAQIVKEFGLSMVNLVMMATFAFMISAIFRSSGMAIGLAIFLMMAGNTIVAFTATYDWAKYILFANTDLNQYMNGSTPLVEGMTLSFSIIVLLVYLTIFLAASWLVFTKRDVAGH